MVLYNIRGDNMKFDETQILKIRKYEQRRGINYIKTTDGKYKFVFALTVIFWLYTVVIASLFVLGKLILTFAEDGAKFDNMYITICVAFIICLISPVFYLFKLKLTGIYMNLIANIVLFISFAKLLLVSGNNSVNTVTEYDAGIFGLKKIFYWRHGVPIFLLSVLLILLAFLIIRERLIMKREFIKISENEYKSEIISDNE